MKTLAHRALADDLVVSVGGSVPFSDADWHDYLATIEPLAKAQRARNELLKLVVFAVEHGPNAKHRSALMEALAGASTRNATLTSSTLAKFVITALSWLGVPAKAYQPEHLLEAMRDLGLSRERTQAVLSAALSLAELVGGSACVERAAGSLARSA